MTEEHHQFRGGRKLTWRVARLIELARELPVGEKALAEIDEFDSVYWFDDSWKPTCRAVTEHALRIERANLDAPIILSERGLVMDGMHRVAKAHLLGHQTIKAVQFPVDPDPDAEAEIR